MSVSVTQAAPIALDAPSPAERETVVRVLSAAAFLIFFQAYMVGPLVPVLARSLGVSTLWAGYLVPAYVLPYGLSTLLYGPLADRFGRRRVMLALLLAMPPVTALTATARGIGELTAWRVLAGVATGGTVPLTLALIGDLYPYRERGRPLGMVFGAIAGGMAFGSTLGAVLEPLLGWRGLFPLVGVVGAGVAAWAWPHRRLLSAGQPAVPPPLRSVVRGYLSLLSTARGRTAYGLIAVNGAFHSGVFNWLGPYFHDVYHLGEVGIGMALLGYGVPGMVLAPTIGRWADRWGRRWLVTSGLLIAAAVAAALCGPMPVVVAAVAVTVLSVGLDLSHPLLAGIVTNLDPARRGQAMGLNAFVLFTGMGLGSLGFGQLLHAGGDRYGVPLGVFAAVLGGLGVAAPVLLRVRNGEVAAEALVITHEISPAANRP
jgi:predicted MFS family arabinose efflux permease